MSNLKYRVLLILALVAVSVWSLFPRKVVERVKRGDTYVFDTVTRVPLKRGLDLQGGMHLALEIDESKGTVADKSEALDRAIKVVRTRIDEFGVAEPVVQKSGTDQIIVELPGIDDPERAMGVVQKSAFLEFQITDKTSALEKALPRFDAILKESGAAVGVAAAAGDTAKGEMGLQELFTPGKDSAAKANEDSTKKDSLALTPGGAFSKLIQQGQFPGEYFVPRRTSRRCSDISICRRSRRRFHRVRCCGGGARRSRSVPRSTVRSICWIRDRSLRVSTSSAPSRIRCRSRVPSSSSR